MPWHLPEDLAHFKRTTLGHTLVMGRRTYDSIGRTLPGRTPSWSPASRLVGAERAGGALAGARPSSWPHGGEVFVAGGGEIYAQALPLADAMVLTEVEQSPEAEVFFPEVDPADWREVAREPHDGFSFVTYERARAVLLSPRRVGSVLGVGVVVGVGVRADPLVGRLELRLACCPCGSSTSCSSSGDIFSFSTDSSYSLIGCSLARCVARGHRLSGWVPRLAHHPDRMRGVPDPDSHCPIQGGASGARRGNGGQAS